MTGDGTVTVVVVTYDAAATIHACLSSLPPACPVIVVDNASTDGTTDAVRAARPDARLVSNDTNRGFAAAVNQAMRHADATAWFLLLNPDARLERGSLDALVAFGARHPRAALISALVLDEDGRPERFAAGWEPTVRNVALHELGLGGRGRGMYAAGRPEGAERRDWVAGTCLLARRQAIDEVGPLDETFFLYGEDLDWARRMRSVGWEVWVEPAARAVHGRSVSVNAAGSWVDEHRHGSLDRYFRRHHGRSALLAFRLARIAGSSLRAVAFSAAGIALRRPELRQRGDVRRRDAVAMWRLLRRP